MAAYTRKIWAETDKGRAPITGADMNRIESGIIESGNPALATVSEIVTGTSTNGRSVTPKVLHDAIVQLIAANSAG